MWPMPLDAPTFGSIDALHNNADIGWTGRFEEVPPEQARRLFDVLLMGPILMTQAALPVLRRSAAGPSVLCSAGRDRPAGGLGAPPTSAPATAGRARFHFNRPGSHAA
jgi:NAD(P)-dependent dehydrogenase (short-subunit alcohol dehydrogenase family)